MSKKLHDSNVDAVKILAEEWAKKMYHTEVSSAHVLIGTLFQLQKAATTSEKYSEFNDKVTSILEKYGANKKFSSAFAQFKPAGVPGDIKLSWSAEATRIFDTLSNLANTEKRSAALEDLMKVIFSDHAMIPFEIYETYVINERSSTVKMFNEIVKASIVTVDEVIDEDFLSKNPALTNLTEYVRSTNPVIIGNEEVVQAIEMALHGKSIRNAVLVGEAGTGKTVTVYKFIQAIEAGTVTEEMRGKTVWQLDPATLAAGAKFSGEFEERLIKVIDAFKNKSKLLLFIDEAHLLARPMGSAENTAANILKPYITRGELQLILATTDAEYMKSLYPDKAFSRRFHKIHISEPTYEETCEILKGITPSLEAHYNRRVSKELIEEAVELADRYTIDFANPAKAINMFELAFAASKVFNEMGEVVMDTDARQAIRTKYNLDIPEERTTASKDALLKMLLGQEEPLEKVMNNLKFVEHNLIRADKPMASMILAGPTGVGKTETAKIIAKKFFGSERSFIKLNMGEYKEAHSVSKILGAPPSYVGHDDETGLIKRVRQYPSSVILFDEIEKAHTAVFDVLLNILDNGELTDHKGNKVSFRNTVIIFTTNLGYSKDFAQGQGAGFVKTYISREDIIQSVEKHFRPEFINRVDDIIVYNGLTREVGAQLVERYRSQYQTNSKNLQLVEFSQEDIDAILDASDIEAYGARGLDRAVKNRMIKIINERENRQTIQDEIALAVKDMNLEV